MFHLDVVRATGELVPCPDDKVSCQMRRPGRECGGHCGGETGPNHLAVGIVQRRLQVLDCLVVFEEPGESGIGPDRHVGFFGQVNLEPVALVPRTDDALGRTAQGKRQRDVLLLGFYIPVQLVLRGRIEAGRWRDLKDVVARAERFVDREFLARIWRWNRPRVIVTKERRTLCVRYVQYATAPEDAATADAKHHASTESDQIAVLVVGVVQHAGDGHAGSGKDA